MNESNLKLADELQKLCCAETEGKFFDLVTDSIGTILAALRASPPSVEPVTWQVRVPLADGGWSNWQNVVEHWDGSRNAYWEYRPLYAAPPSVALDEVLERIIDATNGINGNSALCWLRLADVRKIAETALTRPQPGGAVAGNEKDSSNDPS